MNLTNRRFLALALCAGLSVMAPDAWAQREHGGGGPGGGAPRGGAPRGGGAHAAGPSRQAEPERGPQGYQRIERPQGAQARPQQFDRQAYNHNFNADRGYHVGPYHAPRGFRYRRWGYGDILPRYYWGQQYWLLDYWLFGLDVPPIGYEWVRYGPDAVLIDTRSGEVIQVIYGRFL
jgi:Ni/Co efflux regulator RcnB